MAITPLVALQAEGGNRQSATLTQDGHCTQVNFVLDPAGTPAPTATTTPAAPTATPGVSSANATATTISNLAGAGILPKKLPATGGGG